MSPEEIAPRVVTESKGIKPTGFRYYLKNPAYGPADLNLGSEGRYNLIGTGSLYLGDALETCRLEVQKPDLAAYRVEVSGMTSGEVLDIVPWMQANPELSGSLLSPSGSGGWEPTIEISKRAREAGYAGIQFLSRHDSSRVNTVFWGDKCVISESMFTRIDD